MPKKATAGAAVTTSNSNARPRRAVEVEDFAEDLARILDTARAKAESWIGQRNTVVKHLTDIRDTATHLLSQIEPQPQQLLQRQADGPRSARARSKTNTASNRTPDRPRGRTMSAETRARMAEAQQR